MPAELQTLINDTNTQLKAIGDIYFDGIYDNCTSLHDWLDAEGCPNSADVVLAMRWHFGKLRDKYNTTIGSYRTRLINTLQWINDNWPEDGVAEIDMAMILEAMWNATGGQPLTFISYIDAMRGAIGEKTVFAPYLASYMRHFQ